MPHKSLIYAENVGLCDLFSDVFLFTSAYFHLKFESKMPALMYLMYKEIN